MTWSAAAAQGEAGARAARLEPVPLAPQPPHWWPVRRDDGSRVSVQSCSTPVCHGRMLANGEQQEMMTPRHQPPRAELDPSQPTCTRGRSATCSTTCVLSAGTKGPSTISKHQSGAGSKAASRHGAHRPWRLAHAQLPPPTRAPAAAAAAAPATAFLGSWGQLTSALARGCHDSALMAPNACGQEGAGADRHLARMPFAIRAHPPCSLLQ